MDTRQPDRDPFIKPAESPIIKLKKHHVREKPFTTIPDKPSAIDPDATLPDILQYPEIRTEFERVRAGLKLKDNDATLHENFHPDHTGENAEQESAEQRFRDILLGLSKGTPLPDSYVDLDQPAKKPRTVLQKIGHLVSEAIDQTQLTAIMIAQFGGIHPAKVDGGWHWVVEPWARITNDSKQWEPPGMDTDYYPRMWRHLKAQGIKTIGQNNLPNGDIPDLRPLGLSGLQFLDHNRIKAAQENGLRIRVEFVHYDTYN